MALYELRPNRPIHRTSLADGRIAEQSDFPRILRVLTERDCPIAGRILAWMYKRDIIQ